MLFEEISLFTARIVSNSFRQNAELLFVEAGVTDSELLGFKGLNTVHTTGLARGSVSDWERSVSSPPLCPAPALRPSGSLACFLGG